MKKLFFISISLFAIAACKKTRDDSKASGCLDHNIKQYTQSSPCDDSRVDKYIFQGKTVYVFEPGNCGNDMAAPVMDSNCKVLGSLGGFDGNVSINGEGFHTATFIETVWQKK